MPVPKPAVPGFLKGLGVTARTAKETMFPGVQFNLFKKRLPDCVSKHAL